MGGNSTNLVAEFYAMSRLFLEGYEATLTLGNTKGIDILLYNPRNNKQFRVEVKGSTTILSEKIFGGKNYYWRMNKKHEGVKDKGLVYCFVYADNINKTYRIFIVPSEQVVKYLRWENTYWLKADHKHPVKNNDMRSFRVKVGEKSPYENNFEVFE